MSKFSKRILAVTVLALLLVLTVFSSLLPQAYAQSELQPTTSLSLNPTNNLQAQQSFNIFMNQVAGISMNSYRVTSFNVSTSQVLGSQKQQTCINAIISNFQGTLSISMILIDGKVRFYDLGLLSGSVGGSTHSSFLESLSVSKKTIENYQTYFNASYCDGFDALIPTAAVKSQNFTTNIDNKSLKVQTISNSLTEPNYIIDEWTQSTDGLNLPMQSVQATISNNGIVTSFADTLGLYKVVAAKASISKDQALSTAMDYIKTYSMQNNRQIQSINATLGYTTDFNGTRGDSLSIYPVWTVSSEFAVSTSGTTGYYVAVWGDNGQVKDKGVQGTFSYPCSTLGSQYQPPGLVDPNELIVDSSIVNQIDDWCNDYYGFFACPSYGGNTYANQIYAAANDQGYGGSIVFYIGHGGVTTQGANTYYCITDNSGNPVWNTDIYSHSVYGNHKFAFIWACDQGDSITGMPNAWLHTSALSSNAYTSSDSSGQEFIGFSGPSPYLDGTITSNNIPQSNGGYDLLYCFYYYTLILGFPNNAALDYSVQMLWNQNFGQSVWNTGITTSGGVGHMVCYGDGNLWIGSALRTLTVNYDSSKGYVNYFGNGAFFYNTPVELTAVPNSGYQVTYWLKDGQQVFGSGSTLLVVMNGDHTVEPIFAQNTYTTTVNVYQTWGGSPSLVSYQGSYNIQLPYGSNYLDFTNGPQGGYFMQAYNYADSSTHYSSADWYWTGTGTSISVLWTW